MPVSRPHPHSPRQARWPGGRLLGPALCALVLGAGGCASAPLRVSPDEAPELRARLAERPDDPEVRLRHAAALFAGGECAAARREAETAAAARPDLGLAALITGQCLEAEGQIAEAVDVYEAYLRRFPEGDAADAVRGRLLLAERALALRVARAVVEGGEDGGAEVVAREAWSWGTVAVLPVVIRGDGDGRLGDLSPALTQLLISDLGVAGVRAAERARVAFLLDELANARTGESAGPSAARLHTLLGVDALVQGVLTLEERNVRLEATIAGPAETVVVDPGASGDLQGILDLEKQLALALAAHFAGPLTGARQQRILDNGPRSVNAFLAWAEGLAHEDEGAYREAAAAHRRAAVLDPGFPDAVRRARANAAATTVIGRSPTEIPGAGQRAAAAAGRTPPRRLEGVIAGALHDVASLGPEVALGTLPGDTELLWTPGANQPTPALPAALLLRILVRIPR